MADERSQARPVRPSSKEVRVTRAGSVFTFTMALFCIAGFVTPPLTGLPDYESYKGIYAIGASVFEGNARLFFWVNQVAQSADFDYDQFRAAVLIICVGMLAAAVRLVGKRLHLFGRITGRGSLVNHPLALAAAAAGLWVFQLEFFEVRLRGGMAVAILALAFAVRVAARSPNSPGPILAVLALLVAAYELHPTTTIVLGYLLFAPMVYDYVAARLRFGRGGSNVIWFGAIPVVSFALVFGASLQSADRGENLASPLNPARLVGLAVIPLLLAIATRVQRRWSKPPDDSGVGTASYFTGPMVRRWTAWVNSVSACYLGLAIALLVLYAAGVIGESASGEAMVRIFTLSSLPAIFVLLAPNRYGQIWLFLLLSNSAFFVNSVAGGLFAPGF